MKKLALVGAVAAMFAAPAAMAMGQAELYATSTKLKFEDPSGSSKSDGIGFGIKGWVTVADPFFVSGEYQQTTVEDDSTPAAEQDVSQFRFGGGVAGEIQKGAMWFGKLEYVNLSSEEQDGSELSTDGFGIHGGAMFEVAPQFSVMGSLGYLATSGDYTDTSGPTTTELDIKGLELDVGAHYAITKEVGVALDYRWWMSTIEGPTPPDTDFDLTDLRLGVTFNF